VATVIGTLKKVSGQLFCGVITFTPQETPVAVAGNTVVVGRELEVLVGSDGTFSTQLAAGRYKFTVEGETVYITVPQGSGSYNLTTLIDSPDTVSQIWYNFSYSTLAALKAAEDVFDGKPAILYGELVAGDIDARIYTYDSTSTADGNDGSVVVLDNVPGRWIQRK
jgi:hypothetical protein